MRPGLRLRIQTRKETRNKIMKTTLKPFIGHLVALVALLLTALTMPSVAAAQPDETCEEFPETVQETCGRFLTYWEHNGGLPVFGMPVTAAFSELSSDTLTEHEVQYYERERFEYHPENEGTPYVILLGRLGVDVLTASGTDWMTLPKANPSEDHYMAVTGQAIAPEFWGYWSSHGLDFGDVSVSFRESLALFGYPVTPAQIETNVDGDTVLTQWYERARFELHGDTVLLGRLGAETNDSSTGLAIRVRTELAAAFRMAFESYESEGLLAGLSSPQLGDWVFNTGVADPDDAVPYTGGTYQRIGSVTKTFTTTLILQLADQGLLGLDDTIAQWFDGVTYGDRITVRMLANMTSGIANYTDDEEFVRIFYADPHRIWQPQELVDYAIGLPPSFEPGTDWEYSNSNTVMLGLIIEAVTGQDISSVLQEQILDPLRLVHTSFPANDDDSIPAPYARGRTTQGQPDGQTTDATNWNPSWGWTAGQMISTFDDLLIWARALGTGALLSEAAFAARTDWVTLPPNTPESAYGFGVGIRHGWIGHEGELPGYNAMVGYRPDLEMALVVVTNSDINADSGQSPVTTVFESWTTIINREYPLPLTDA